MSDLTAKKCMACEGGVAPLTKDEILKYLSKIPGWSVDNDHKSIYRSYRFNNFHETMAFINAIAWLAHQENHHPDVEFGYNYCFIHYTTHAIDGLSENDIICAAKVNALLD